jgi:hypothetical protein
MKKIGVRVFGWILVLAAVAAAGGAGWPKVP